MDLTQIVAASAAALAVGVPGAAAQDLGIPGAAADDQYYVKVKPNLAVKVAPKRDRFAPFRYTASRKLGLNGAPREAGCQGNVFLRVRRGARTVTKGTTRIDSECMFTKKLIVKARKVRPLTRGTLKVSARFGGNAVLQPDAAPVRKVQFG